MSPKKRTSQPVAFATAVGLAFRADPKRAVLVTLLQIATAASWVVSSWYSSRLIGDLITADYDSARVNALIAGVSTGGAFLYLGIWRLDLRFRMEVTTTGYVEKELITLSTDLVHVEHHEREEYVAEIELLRQARGALGNSSAGLLENVGAFVTLFSTVGILASVHVGLWLLPLAGIPVVVASGWTQTKIQRTQEALAPNWREATHLETLCTTAAPAKEVRVFGLAELLREREGRRRDEAETAMRGVLLRTGLVSTGAWALFGAAYVGALAFIVDGAVAGRFNIADVVLVVTLAATIAERVAAVVGMAGWLTQTLIVVGRYRWLRDEVGRLRSTVEHPSLPSGPVRSGITLDHVHFTYPGTDVEILQDIDVQIPAGTTVAVVGDNGAGKSTLVKLLARMYEPTNGRIVFDGIDIADLDASEWRSVLSAGFQDHCRYEFLAQRVVGLGHLPDLDDASAATNALACAASASLVDQLDDELATPLGRSFESGRELSGGQWQKLAIGRAMMRPEPKLLVLDEPTSALDAETEHELFTQYAAAVEAVAARTGGITVLVSHRFSTVRMADLILVLDGNRLAEVGPHAELVAADGLYAELYELQARAYR